MFIVKKCNTNNFECNSVLMWETLNMAVSLCDVLGVSDNLGTQKI